MVARRPGLVDRFERPLGDLGPDGDPELTLQLPPWLADVIGRRRDAFTRTDAVAGALLLAQVAVLALLVGRGSLYLDDLRAQAATLKTSFGSFVFSPAEGPFAPLPRALDWIQGTQLTLQHWPATVAALLVRVALGVAFYRLLRRLVGPHPLIVVPFGVLLFTPALLVATSWERPAVTVLAATAAGLWAVDAFVAWQLGAGPRSLVVVAVATFVACSCHVAGIAVPGVLLALQVTFLAGRDRTRGLPGAVRGLAAAVVPVGAFLALYLTRSGAGATPAAPHGPGDVAAAVGRSLLHQVVPGLLGGPYGWSHARPYAAVLSPGTTLTVLFWAAAVLGVAVAARRAPGRTARAAGFLLLVLLAVAGVASVARTDAVGVLFSRADLVTVLLVPYVVLAAALAVFAPEETATAPVPDVAQTTQAALPAHDGPPSDVPMTRRERRLAEAAAPAPAQPSPARPDAPREIGTGGLTFGVAAAAVLVGSLVSTVTFAGAWWDNPTGTWLATMRGYVGSAEAYPRILATPPPAAVSPAAQTRVFGSVAPLVLLLRPDARFHDADGPARALNELGALNAPLAANLSSSDSSGCVGAIRGGTRSTRWLELEQDARYVEGAQIEVGFLSAAVGRVEVSMQTPQGRRLTPVRYSDSELPAGAHQLHVEVPYGEKVHAVQVTTTAGGDFCVTSVKVWAPLQ